MEKYCTILIFVWLGLPLLIRGLILLESDASLIVDSSNGVTTVFGNQDDNHDNSSFQISTGGHESAKSGSLNIDEEFNNQNDKIVSPSFENQDDNPDYSSLLQVSASGHESTKSKSLNTDGESNNEDEEIVSSSFKNQDDNHGNFSSSQASTGESTDIEYLNVADNSSDKLEEIVSPSFENQDENPDYSSSSQVSASDHESTKSRSLNVDGESNNEDEEIASPRFENQDENHDDALSPQISTDESTKGEYLNIAWNSSDKDDETNSPSFENSTDYHNYPIENLIDIDGREMLESDPVMEEMPGDIELVYQMNKRRNVPERGLTEETKKLMLELHNEYRGNVTPPAGDMNFLEWDDSLAHLAQLWADTCMFKHGRPPNTNYHYEGKVYPYGQNLYLGTDPSGYKSLWMWYEEYMHYDLRNQTCKPNEQCGHYVQMAWAESKRLGCGIRLCGMRYLIACHYYPGAIKGVQMFQVGRPCSLCNEEEGALCKDKLCVSHEMCKRKPEFCESATCNLKCRNCGRLNKTSCQCTCADGWDSPDCSKLCANEHERCGVKPGFPHKASCSIQNYSVAKKYCRKMCDTCATVTHDTTVNHLCCEGRLCKKGYVLDLERKPCRCTLLCPGPLCDFLEDESSALKYNFFHLISQIMVFYFMNYTHQTL